VLLLWETLAPNANNNLSKHRDISCKLLRLRLLPDKYMVRIIMELVGNRSFTIGNDELSRLRRFKNGVPQGSILALLLFNIYTSDLPTSVSRKYAYANDRAIVHADGN